MKVVEAIEPQVLQLGLRTGTAGFGDGKEKGRRKTPRLSACLSPSIEVSQSVMVKALLLED